MIEKCVSVVEPHRTVSVVVIFGSIQSRYSHHVHPKGLKRKKKLLCKNYVMLMAFDQKYILGACNTMMFRFTQRKIERKTKKQSPSILEKNNQHILMV